MRGRSLGARASCRRSYERSERGARNRRRRRRRRRRRSGERRLLRLLSSSNLKVKMTTNLLMQGDETTRANALLAIATTIDDGRQYLAPDNMRALVCNFAKLLIERQQTRVRKQQTLDCRMSKWQRVSKKLKKVCKKGFKSQDEMQKNRY